MRLSDVVSYLDITVYPIVGLLAFCSVFVLVAWRALRTPTAAMERRAALPLDSDTPDQPTPATPQTPEHRDA